MLITFLNAGLVVLGSPCSEQNRTIDFGTCKNKIIETLFDPSLFWFGSDYNKICPNGAASGIMCSNPSPSKTSIAVRLFSSNVFNNIDRFLELHYESTGKDYTACGNTFKSDETWSYNVDPTSDTVVTPWYVKNFPIAINWNYTAGDKFTLIVYDVSYLITHGVYVNIDGDDILTAEDIKPYHGPQIATTLKNPYIFLLFKQPGPVNISEEWKTKITEQNMAKAWSLEDFTDDYNLTDRLVGVNWIVATGDEYGALLASSYIYMCPIFATKALLVKPRPFIPNDTMLTVWLDFTFSNAAHNITVCCRTDTYSAGNVTTNPIGNPIFSTWETRSEANHSLTFMKMGYIGQVHNFSDDTYTVITIDPDVPSATAGTQERPLLHGMSTNIKNGDMKTGEDIMSYSGPTPPDYTPHYYYTLLYKQEGEINGTALRYDYDGDCSGGLAGRCLYDINRAVSENNLTLVGATWFRATTDAYVRQRYIERGNPETEVCKGQPGYSKPCSTQGSPISLPSTVVLGLMFLLAILSR